MPFSGIHYCSYPSHIKVSSDNYHLCNVLTYIFTDGARIHLCDNMWKIIVIMKPTTGFNFVLLD